MVRRFVSAAVIAAGVLTPAGAALARELAPAELRALSASGGSAALSRIYDRIRTATGGEPMDVRAFDVGGVFYRVLVMMPNGTLASVVVDARNGALVPPNSRTAQQVRAEAQGAPGRSGSAPGRSNGTAANNGRGNAGNNGQGNGGNNGQGNGGGNNGGGNGGGNDNGGNNGQGNGGGNGNGNGNN